MTLKLNGTNSVAAPAYAGDDADTGLQCGTNELKLVTGGSTKVAIKDNGNCGIGTITPDAKLEVAGEGSLSGTPYEYDYSTDAGIKVVGNESTIDILSTDAGDHGGSLLIRGVNRGFAIINNPTNSVLSINSFTASAANFNVHGSTGLNLSSHVEVANFRKEGGICFNGDTAAANALDDYEEGTFTPAINRQSSAPTVSYSYRSGSYVKIGKLVLIYFDLNMTANSGGSGRYRITGLPFSTATDNLSGGYGSPQFRSSSAFNSDARQNNTSAFHSDSVIQLLYMNNSGNETDIGVSTGRITGWSVYMTNS